MVSYAQVTVGSPVIASLDSNDFENLRVKKSLSHESDSFEGTVYNTAGRNGSIFAVGQEIKMFHNLTSEATGNQIFFGRVEFVDYSSFPNKEKIRVGGRDYTSFLMDSIHAANYSSGTGNVIEVGSVVRDIIWRSDISGIIGTSLVSGTDMTLKSFRIKNKSIYEAVSELAKFVEYDFYVDYDKNLVFRPINNKSTGFTFNNGNVNNASFETNSQEMYNKVTVYGDRQLIRNRESFTANGVGSVFTLVYNPHNTFVTVDGTRKQGGVFELVDFASTGTQYLVDFDRRNIIFASGTAVGDNVPGSLAAIVIDYDRSIPIIKQAQNESSISTYGLRETIIVNKEITSPNQALEVASAELNRLQNPIRQGNVSIRPAISGLQPGETVIVNLPNDNIDDQTFKIFETSYDISKDNLLYNNVLGIRVGIRIQDTSDILKGLILKGKKLESGDTDTSDVVSRLKFADGSFAFSNEDWFVRIRDVGSSFILGHPVLGLLGSPAGGARQPYLGDSRSGLFTFQSGGDFLT